MEIFLIFYAIAAIISFQAILKFIKYRHFVNTVNRIPGPKSYPFMGTMWEFRGVARENLFQVQLSHTKTYDGIYRRWVAGLADVKLERAEYIEKILNSNTHINKSDFYELQVREWLGNGLIVSTGDIWQMHRKILTPAFHFSILEGFCDVFAEKCLILIQKLMKFADTGKAVDVFPYVNHCALDIICETAMGIHMNAQETGESEYVKAIQEITTLGIQKLINPLYHYNWIFYLTSYGARNRKALKTAHDFTDKVIQERKEVRKRLSGENNKKRRKAFLDLILDATEKNKSFTDKDIREEVDNFMFAGHDTTSITAVYAFYLLGLNPKVQQKLYEEQVAIFGDSKELPTHKILGEMKYMDLVMKECIRVLPTVPNISRKLTADMEIGGYKIPAGCNVTVGIYAVTRDERYFPDPEKFDPDRFLPENLKKLHPYAFLPFSAGPRNCIGQKFAQLEEKVFLSMMIRNFKITSVDPFETFKFVPEIVARPVHGVNLILEKRLL